MTSERVKWILFFTVFYAVSVLTFAETVSGTIEGRTGNLLQLNLNGEGIYRITLEDAIYIGGNPAETEYRVSFKGLSTRYQQGPWSDWFNDPGAGLEISGFTVEGPTTGRVDGPATLTFKIKDSYYNDNDDGIITATNDPEQIAGEDQIDSEKKPEENPENQSNSPNENAPNGVDNLNTGGDPVNLTNGEFYFSRQDHVAKGRMLDVVIKHFYRSKSEYNSPFGFGWDMNYNLKVRKIAGLDRIIFLDGNNNKIEYENDGNGNYKNTKYPGRYFTYDGDSFTLHEKYGIRYIFDTNGNLSHIKDNNDNTLSFYYSENLMSVSGRSDYFLGLPNRRIVAEVYQLTQITDDLGKEIDFTYYEDNIHGTGYIGLLQSIRYKPDDSDDSKDRVWTYTYDQYNNLKTVQEPSTTDYPDGLMTIYHYDDENDVHALTSLEDPKGQSYTVNNYQDGKVSTQVYGTGFTEFFYNYDPDPDPDPDIKQVKLLSKYDDTQDIQSVTTYNDNGSILTETISSLNLRTDPPDPASEYTTSYTYYADGQSPGSDGRLESITYPRGDSVVYEYDAAGNVKKITQNPVPGSDEAVADETICTSFTYEPTYNFIKTVTDSQDNTVTYTYDSGNLIAITYPEVQTPDGPQQPEMYFTYNSSGQVETVTSPDGVVTEYQYYEDNQTDGYNYGRLKRVTYDRDMGQNGITYEQMAVEYQYDEAGNVIETTADPENLIISTEYVYNKLNQLKMITPPAPYSDLTTTFFYDETKKTEQVDRAMPNHPSSNVQTTSYTYDILDHLKTVTDSLGNTTELDYDFNEHVSIIEDAVSTDLPSADKYYTNMDYDERGLLWKVTDAEQGVTEYFYDENGNLSSIKDAKGQTTTYEYDGFNRLKKTTYPDDTFEQFKYDSMGNLTKYTNRDGQSQFFAYDALGRMVSINIPSESAEEYTYDIAGRLIGVRDTITDGLVGHWTLDEDAVIDSSGYGNDGTPVNDMTARAGIIGQTLEFNGSSDYIRIDENVVFNFSGTDNFTVCGWFNFRDTSPGQALIWKGNSDHQYFLTYNNSSELIFRVYDPDNKSSKAFYALQPGDLDNWVFIVGVFDDGRAKLYLDGVAVGSEGTQIISARSTSGDLFVGRRSDNAEWRFDGFVDDVRVYERPLNPDEIAALADLTPDETFVYDRLGRPETVTNASGKQVGYDYDSLGRQNKLVYPDRSEISYEYDKLNRLVKIFDDDGITEIAEYTYDDLSRRKELYYDYDLNGTYDGSISYDYEDADTDGDDLGNRLEQIANDINGTSITFDYTYDNVGNCLTKDDGTKEHTYGYDLIYQLLTDNLNVGTDVSLTYDALGNRLTMNDGEETTYVPNNVNQYTTHEDDLYDYDTNGNLIGDGQYIYKYDSQNRLIGITPLDDISSVTPITLTAGTETHDPGILDYDTTYYWCVDEMDSGENIIGDGDIWTFTTKADQNVPSIFTDKGVYDPDGGPNATMETIVTYFTNAYGGDEDGVQFSLDGNPLNCNAWLETQGAVSLTFESTDWSPPSEGYYQAQLWHLIPGGDPEEIENWIMDAYVPFYIDSDPQDDNKAAYPNPPYCSIDVDVDRYLSWTKTSHQDLVFHNLYFAAADSVVPTVSYEYDSAGRRSAKITPDLRTEYVYDGPQVIAEYEDDGGGSGLELARKFIYGPGLDEPIAMIDVDGETQTWYFYHYDGLGSVVALSNTSGSIVERYQYTAFGITKVCDGNGTPRPENVSAVGNPYMFTGRRYDSETGLYYYRARMYSPQLGRFMQTDPIGYADGMNLYAYCGNNPVNWIDPWGLDALGPLGPFPIETPYNFEITPKQANQVFQNDVAIFRAVVGGLANLIPKEGYINGTSKVLMGSGMAILGSATSISTAGATSTNLDPALISGGVVSFGLGVAEIIATANGEDFPEDIPENLLELSNLAREECEGKK